MEKEDLSERVLKEEASVATDHADHSQVTEKDVHSLATERDHADHSLAMVRESHSASTQLRRASTRRTSTISAMRRRAASTR